MALQLSLDGQVAIAGDFNGNVRAIATDTGAAAWEAKLPNLISTFQLSPDGHLAIAGESNGNVRAFAADTGAAS